MSSLWSYLLNRLFMFLPGAQCVCCSLFPGHRKRPESERGFFLVHLKNSSIVLCRSPHCCGNVWPSWRTLCTSTACVLVEVSLQSNTSYTTTLKHTITCLLNVIFTHSYITPVCEWHDRKRWTIKRWQSGVRRVGACLLPYLLNCCVWFYDSWSESCCCCCPPSCFDEKNLKLSSVYGKLSQR